MTVRTYRQSAVKRFLRCPRSYDLGYRQNLQLKGSRATFSKSADVGTMFHAGLEAYYLRENPIAAVLARGEMFAEQYGETPEVVKGVRMARTMIEGYIEWQADNGYDQGWKVLVAEERISIPVGTILGDTVSVDGQIDLAIEDGNGDVYVIDGKSCDQFDKYIFNIQESFQLQFYDMLIRHSKCIQPAGAVYNMAKRVLRTGAATPPFYRREVVRFNNTQRANFEQQVLGTLELMVAADQAVEANPNAHQRKMPPNSNGDCKWDCDFLPVCSMRDTGDHFADALEDMYQVRLPDPERKPNAA